MGVESSYRGCWSVVFNLTSRLSIAGTKPKDISRESIFATNQRKTATTARRESRCVIAAWKTRVKAISTTQQRRNAKPAHRRGFALQHLSASCMCTGKSQLGKQFVHWPERQNSSAHGGRVIKSKRYLQKSNNRKRYEKDD